MPVTKHTDAKLLLHWHIERFDTTVLSVSTAVRQWADARIALQTPTPRTRIDRSQDSSRHLRIVSHPWTEGACDLTLELHIRTRLGGEVSSQPGQLALASKLLAAQSSSEVQLTQGRATEAVM